MPRVDREKNFSITPFVNGQKERGYPAEPKTNLLVVSTHLKNISQIGSFPQIELKQKHHWNHHLICIYIYICIPLEVQVDQFIKRS